MAVESSASDLVDVVVLLGAAVVAVPVFRRLGLGSVLGYLAAGLAIGPFGFAFFTDPQSILHVAELGVVMFLFVIGLEMRPSHLWNLRSDIFGLGTFQISTCALLLTASFLLLGLSAMAAFMGAMGFVLTSTAVVMQLLTERGDIALPRGQKIVSILLFEDLLIVPLLALVAFLSPNVMEEPGASRWINIGIAVASVVGLIAAGRYLLNPLFRILAVAKAREVMTAAALLVVLGAALLMDIGGLSMAMGAFLAGVLLSESTFRHQIEADIEPFRGVLLGLFFLSVGMSLDLAAVARNWPLIVGGVLVLMATKALGIYAVARMTGCGHDSALERAVLMAQGGEFAFVLFTAAGAAGLIDASTAANLTALVVLSMALTPLFDVALRTLTPARAESMDGIEMAFGAQGSVLVIGFGRFGQVTCQNLLARNVDVTIIDNDVEMIRSAAEFGFKIFYGDGTRLDVMQASGARVARLIAVCIDDRSAANRIVELAHVEFPQAKLMVRSFDREHALELISAGVDFQIRETFEAAMRFGEEALVELGLSEAEAAEIAADVRRRDAERVTLELTGGLSAGTALMHKQPPKPTPFTPPKRESQPLNQETATVATGAG